MKSVVSKIKRLFSCLTLICMILTACSGNKNAVLEINNLTDSRKITLEASFTSFKSSFNIAFINLLDSQLYGFYRVEEDSIYVFADVENDSVLSITMMPTSNWTFNGLTANTTDKTFEAIWGKPIYIRGNTISYFLDQEGISVKGSAEATYILSRTMNNSLSIRKLPKKADSFGASYENKKIDLSMNRNQISKTLAEEPIKTEISDNIFEQDFSKGLFNRMRMLGDVYYYPDSGISLTCIGDFVIEIC